MLCKHYVSICAHLDGNDDAYLEDLGCEMKVRARSNMLNINFARLGSFESS